MDKVELMATCTFGLEGILKEEIIKLGFKDIVTTNGRVTYTGDLSTIARSNLWLRTADRVLLKIGSFKAFTFDELFEKTKALPWEEWIPRDGEFPAAKATSVKSKLYSKSDCQRIVKKAIVERLKKTYKLTWLEETGEKFPVQINILKDVVTLSIDTSGSGLNRRGYRIVGNDAPIKETLASAMVYMSRWDPSRILADPLCGSGTILIEAALIGKNIAPGLYRDFISENWPKNLKDIYREERVAAKRQINDLEFRLLGSDIDKKSINIANENAQLAKVEDLIAFQKLDIADFSSKKKYGVIITNPPYGERISTKKEVEKLYQTMGDVYNSLEDWSLFLLTSHLNFERYFGKRATKNRKLYNGNILTYLYQYYGKIPKRKYKEI